MKKIRKSIYFLVILICMMSIVYYNYRVFPEVKDTNSYYLGYFSEVPQDYDELISLTYGQSSYFTIIDDVKISIEKIVQEKYYIIYSWVNGDQSYFAINLILENINKERLKSDSFEYLYIKDDQGKIYLPLPYYKLIDFPPEQPLGWKQLLYVKFDPIDKDAKCIDVYITYAGVEKVIKNIELD